MPPTKKTPIRMKRKIAKPITKAKNTTKRKKQLKSVAVNFDDVLGNTEVGDQACMNILGIKSESIFISPTGLTMSGIRSNDFVMFNNKVAEVRLEKCALPKINVTSAPSSNMPNDESSTSGSISSSTSSSDSKLNHSTSASTNVFPIISDIKLEQCDSIAGFTDHNGTKIKDEEEIVDFRLPSQENNCAETSSSERCRLHQTNVHADSIAGFTDHNGTKIKDEEEIVDFRLPSQENNCAETSSSERCRLHQTNVHADSIAGFTDHNGTKIKDEEEIVDFRLPSQENNCAETSSSERCRLHQTNVHADSIAGFTDHNGTKIKDEEEIVDFRLPSQENNCAETSSSERCRLHQTNVHADSIAGFTDHNGTKIKDEEEIVDFRLPSQENNCAETSSSERCRLHQTNVHAEDSIKRSQAQVSSHPYQNVDPVRSSLYRGVFSISSQCRNSSCGFTHAMLNINTFKFRLQGLDKDTLIAEYLQMCAYESLKRKYYLLFVEECKRRKATRIFFKMAIDLGLGYVSIDEDIRLKVLEMALLYLNTINIDVCKDLLKFEHKGTMMCNVLLSCMANSQNFTKFKRAFVKLAQLMCELKQPADIQVASSILERMLTLPGDSNLARGMTALMNADLETSLAGSLEDSLAQPEGISLQLRNSAP